MEGLSQLPPGYGGIAASTRARTPDGELLLVELEDHSPYLSLDLAPAAVGEAFIDRVAASLRRLLESLSGSVADRRFVQSGNHLRTLSRWPPCLLSGGAGVVNCADA